MDTLFMNSKTSDPHRLINNLLYKIDFQRSGKYIALSNLTYTVHGKIKRSYPKTINLKYQLQREMKNLDYLIGHILQQIFKIILSI